MKAVMLMFDTLNRDFLPPYGCAWTQLPNFKRLQEKALTFDHFYAGSLPCMPARRELHTGKYCFLHRGWGPLEPYDDSAIERMKKAGVYTHLASDHTHYWEDGGATYHTRYNTWQFSRGQEGDPWMGQVKEPDIPEGTRARKVGSLWRQDWVNRQFTNTQNTMPQTLTMNNGLDFIARNHQEDKWFLQIELFDPHEPFFAPEKFCALYPHHYSGPHLDWPDYGPNDYTEEETEHLRKQYAALLTMCDDSLGRLLDTFDEKDLWKDTMLIVNTDHGFLLGEQDWMGKNIMPCYEEIVHTPFFIWDPRHKQSGQRRGALAQTVDIAPTLLAFFGLDALPDIDGEDLAPIIKKDAPVRQAGLFGVQGGHVNVTDGQYVLMRAPRSATNQPLFDYTLMPTHMSTRFSVEELKGATLVPQPDFAPCPVLKIPVNSYVNAYWYGDLLFDVQSDPGQHSPLQNEAAKLRMLDALCDLMRRNKAPADQYLRLGLPQTGPVTAQWLAAEGARQPVEMPEGLAKIKMTETAQTATVILLSMTPPNMQEKLVGGIKMAATLTPGAFTEDKLFGLLQKFLPPAFSGMAVSFIQGYLRYQPAQTKSE